MAMKVKGGAFVPKHSPEVAEARNDTQKLAVVLGDMEAKARVAAGLLDNLRRNNIPDQNIRERLTMKAIAVEDDYESMRQAMTRFIMEAKRLIEGMDAITR